MTKKSQTSVIGAILIVLIATIGVILFYSKLKDFMNKSKEYSTLPLLTSQAIDLKKDIEYIIKYEGNKEFLFETPNALLTIYNNGNFSALIISTNIPADNVLIEPITTKFYYREVCKINNDDHELVGCFLSGYKLEDLQQFCSIYYSNLLTENNLYYCLPERLYTIKTFSSQKFLVSVYPTPKLNSRGNKNLCDVYLVNFNSKKTFLFVCDYWIEGNTCYFPIFRGQIGVYLKENEKRNIEIEFGGLEKTKNLYPFCNKSYLYIIKLKAIQE